MFNKNKKQKTDLQLICKTVNSIPEQQREKVQPRISIHYWTKCQHRPKEMKRQGKQDKNGKPKNLITKID